ncbi:hypothetical protein, partial [Mesorhizobium sp. M2A.F.Ca.ET.039.01.1.1]|uniref:hypothetical protein n=1 Tax=Mesorhizobium sp. M2A.F.Ca.ET.039.01.1.1 TaxID=2496746 RepID=UPI000FF63C73
RLDIVQSGLGRADLIGPRPDQLVPAHQPPGTGKAAATKRPVRPIGRGQRFTTKGVPFPKKCPRTLHLHS